MKRKERDNTGHFLIERIKNLLYPKHTETSAMTITAARIATPSNHSFSSVPPNGMTPALVHWLKLMVLQNPPKRTESQPKIIDTAAAPIKIRTIVSVIASQRRAKKFFGGG
jgi:hypothetical protein